MENRELYHYGVKGMKLGVRTSRTVTYRFGDHHTDREKKKMTKIARKVVKSQRKIADVLARDNQVKADRAYRKADMKKYKEYKKRAKRFFAQQRALDRTLSGINDGTLKAGRDFVTRSTYSTNLLLDAAGLYNLRSEHDIRYKIK